LFAFFLQKNAEAYFVTLHEIQEKIAPVVNLRDIQVIRMDSRDMKEEKLSDVMVKHENQHESRWGDKVDQQDEKKKVETIKSDTAMECN
jgi:hypothetical protein